MIDWLACTLVKGFGGLLCRVPPEVAVWVGERLGELAYWFQPKRSRIGLLNLRAAFGGRYSPAEARRIIRACYRQLGAGIVELLRLPVIDRAYVDRYVTIEGRVHFEAAMASDRPVMFLTGHSGNWELSSITAALHGYPIVALARAQQKLPKLYRLLVSYRESKGCTIIHKGGAMRRLIAALDARKLVGIVGDQASRQGIFTDFFGRPALFATGPFELAYRKGALIFPAFMRRLHGPHHRLTIEPPIAPAAHREEAAAVRGAIEQFAEVLSRHIAEDPRQWLWMHKRWKHTPARRLLVLSDGKLGHVKQSLAVVEAMRSHCPGASSQLVEVRYRHPLARALALLWSGWLPRGLGATTCLRLALAPQSADALLGRYADVVVSCGSSTAPVNLLWAGDNRAKSVIIMNPSPLPLRRFSLVVAPRHDRLRRRANVVQISGALASPLAPEALARAGDRLATHPNFRARLAGGRHPPVVAVFIGGDTPHYAITASFADSLIAEVTHACERLDGWCLVTTSRRTPLSVERLLAERLERHPRCGMLLIATRDPIDGTMPGMLGWADVALVTGESISMISEACASGRQVVVVPPPSREHRAATTKHERFLRELVREGFIRLAPLPELAATLQRLATTREPTKRLDDFAVVRDAVARLL